MSRSFAILSVVFLGCVGGSALPLYGQVGAVPGISPFSPWLNMYQKHGGPLDQYHMFVQPAEEQQNAFQSLQFGIQHNANTVNSVADQFSSQADATRAAGTPTGVGAGFMNQGKYFGTTGGGGSGTFGLPGTGGFGRPGGVGQFGTPGLGGASMGMGMQNPSSSFSPNAAVSGAGAAY